MEGSVSQFENSRCRWNNVYQLSYLPDLELNNIIVCMWVDGGWV